MSATRIPGADSSVQVDRAAQQQKEAAKGLEAYFIRQVFSELTKDGGGLGLAGGGFAGSTFGDMLNEALSDAVAEGGGLGIAKQLGGALGDGTNATSASGSTHAVSVAPIEASTRSHRSSGLSALGGSVIGAGGTFRASGPLASVMRARAAYGAASSPALASPLDHARLTSGFGSRTDPLSGAESHHDGLDLAAPEGTPVKSAGAGVVLRAESEPGYGNVVVVNHGNGVETRYAHLARLDVKAGDRVAAGTEVGLVGSTGRSTGPHLHFEVRKSGKSIDPATALSPLAKLR